MPTVRMGLLGALAASAIAPYLGALVTDLRDRLQAAVGDVYRIERELGGGGMSRLFLATEASLSRQVVIKLLPPEFASEVSARRFKQELEVAARLQHTNILPVLTGGAKDDLLFYVMPFVSGESLRHRLTREGKLPIADAVRILHEIADALMHAHAAGVIHRDIKPENILLLGEHAVLTDFGVARALAESGSGQQLTDTGFAVGTPGYMSPEQAAGERHLDARADVYALAVVGYEMLAGTMPFTGPSAQAVLAAHLTATPKPVVDLRPDTPAHVSNVIARALAKDPNARLATAAEFRDALMPAKPAPRVRTPWRIGLAAGGVVAAVALAVLLLRPKTGATLDPNLLAVAPFDVVTTAVEEYREGLMTILSRTLDGAGPIRTISPTVVVRRWSGRSDPTSADAFGRATGAGLVVFGQAVPAGADSVVLTATVYDVEQAHAVGEVETRDARDRIDRAADTLAVRVLRELGRTRAVGAVRFAALGSTSLPAIKLFLRAEQFYRQGQWDSTVAYARQAVAVDSTFTLALRRIASAQWWGNTANATPMQLLAGANSRGLAPRESLLVTLDSLWGALEERVSARWPLLRRLGSTAEEAVTRYPEDPEAWYMKGELAYHYGDWVEPRLPPDVAFDAFARAIALDSAFAPAFEHIILLAQILEEPALSRQYADAFLRLHPQRAAALRASLDLLASPSHPSAATAAWLDTASLAQLTVVNTYLGYTDSGEAAVIVARARVKARGGEASWVLAAHLAARGHVREAAQQLWAYGPRSNVPAKFAAVQLLLVGALPPDSAARWLESLLHDGDEFAGVGLGWWAARGDTASMFRLARLAESKRRSAAPGSREAEYWTYARAAVQPYLALAHHDTSRALDLFAGLPDSLCRHCITDRWARVRLLSAQHRDREAAPLLDEPLYPADWASAVRVLWSLERGRVNDRLGNRDKAVESYALVAGMWQHADPELQPYVEEARAGIARLTGERQ